MASKKKVVKISPETVAKHVKIANGLVKKGKGKLPTYSWLNANGYFRTYEVMRAVPSKFKHIKRSVAA
jgi:hypothetical protein